jgi:chromosome partitioning protein
MHLIAITNQKGGVGKTTTAINLSAAVAVKGYKVLLIDLDPQANATSGLGLEQEAGRSIYAGLMGDIPMVELAVPTSTPGLEVIRSHQELAGCEIELAQSGNHLSRLREMIQPLREKNSYDFVFIDCPPSLGVLMTTALSAVDYLLVPIQCEYFGLEGLSKIIQIAGEIKACGANPNLQLEGMVMTMFDSRANLAQQVVQEVRNSFGDQVYSTMIPRSIRLGEAPSFGKTILQYESGGKAATAYHYLADELITRFQSKA